MEQSNCEATLAMAIPLGAKALQSCPKMRQEGRGLIFQYQPVLRCELSPKHSGPYTLDGNLVKTAPLGKAIPGEKYMSHQPPTLPTRRE